MSRFIVVAGTDEAAAVRFPDGMTTSSAAEQGSVGIGNVEIDDPTGAFDFKPLNAAYIVEGAASPTRLWTGFLHNLTIDRGPYVTGAGRVWRAECVDINSLLTRRIVLSSNGNRPAETDLVRLTWLLANPVLSGLVYSGSLTNLSTNARGLDAANYYWQTPMEILADIAPQCGKVAWAFYNPSTARTELFYDLVDASTNDSTAKISNVLSDAGAGVYFPFMNASMERSGENMASKAVLRWVGGVTVGENLTTKSTYGEMTYTWDSSRVGRATTATSQVATILANKSLPEETVTCLLLLPAANVNDILEGQRIQCKFSHLPGLSSYTWMRVIRRAVGVDESNRYLVQLTLSNKARVGLGGGPGTGDFPHPTGLVAIVNSYAARSGGASVVTWPFTPTAGNVLVVGMDKRAASVSTDPESAGWTRQSNITSGASGTGSGGALFTKVSDGTEVGIPSPTGIYGSGLYPFNYVIWEVSGADLSTIQLNTVNTSTNSTAWTAGSVTTASASAFVAGFMSGGNDFAAMSWTPGAGWTEYADLPATPNAPGATAVARITTASGSYNPASTCSDSRVWIGFAISLEATTASTQPPTPGQWFDFTATPAADGTTTTFNSPFAFADLSLSVKVNRLDQTPAIVSYDGEAKTFTLAFAPKTGWLIEGRAQGR